MHKRLGNFEEIFNLDSYSFDVGNCEIPTALPGSENSRFVQAPLLAGMALKIP